MSVPAALLGIVLIWSTTPLAIKWSSEEVGFLFGLSARMFLGVLICLMLLALLRHPFRWHRSARHTYLASGLGLYVAMMLVYWGARYISSGLVAVVYGLLPILTYFISALVLGESLRQPEKLFGAVLGFVGLLVVFDPKDGVNAMAAVGVAAVFGSAVVHSLSMIVIKRIGADISALAVTTGGLAVAVPLYLFTWALFDGHLPHVMTSKTVSSIVYLGFMGSVVGFIAFYYALKHVSPNAIALLTLITPVLALGLGHSLNHEPLNAQVVTGALLIVTGLASHHWGARLVRARPSD